MIERGSSRTWGIALGVVVLLLCGYVGAYYALVESSWGQPFYGPGHNGFGTVDGATMNKQVFRERFFAPAHWLDRRIRPKFWRSPFDAWKP